VGDAPQRIGRSPDTGDSAVYALAQKFMPGAGLFEYYREQAAKLKGATPMTPQPVESNA
jgi:hypothetical protein